MFAYRLHLFCIYFVVLKRYEYGVFTFVALYIE